MFSQTAWSNDAKKTSGPDPDSLATNGLSVAVIGPDERSRANVAGSLSGSLSGATRELSFYPELDQIPKLIELNYDVIVIDLDSSPEYALDVVEYLCSASPATVMVYSSGTDPDLMIRCMRAGAREFLTVPLGPGALAEAMVRASVRRTSVRTPRKSDGRLCVFWGAKGGTGVTTIASNFAICAARESSNKVLLIDLDLPLGDAALSLGITPQYSATDALENHQRLDANFLSGLVAKHESGLSVLAAPGKLVYAQTSTEAIDKLIAVARQEFDCVVVDSGSRFALTGTSLFGPEALVYLVSQVGIPELRNSNRLMSELFAGENPKVEIILNRFANSSIGMDDEHITRALTRPAQWKVPNDYSAVRKMQNTATPLALNESQISRVIRQMARTALGLPMEPERRKKIIGLF